MKALRVTGNRVSLAEITKPDRGDEALIRVRKSGICNTDLEIIKGYSAFNGTLGHEFVGEVVDSPEEPDWVEKRVVGEINVGCETCDWCATNDARHCPNRTVLGIVGRDGCHGEFVNLPVRNLLEVPTEVSDEEAVFIEPLAAAYGITEQIEFSPGAEVAVIGDGKLGILCAWSLATRADHLYLIGKYRSKLSIAETENVEGVLLESILKLKRKFDIVVEASGSESGFKTAMELVKPRGKIVLKSTFHGKAAWQASQIVVDEISIVGSRCGKFAPALELLKKNKFDLRRLITDEFPLSKAIAAINEASSGGTLKVLLAP